MGYAPYTAETAEEWIRVRDECIQALLECRRIRENIPFELQRRWDDLTASGGREIEQVWKAMRDDPSKALRLMSNADFARLVELIEHRGVHTYLIEKMGAAREERAEPPQKADDDDIDILGLLDALDGGMAHIALYQKSNAGLELFREIESLRASFRPLFEQHYHARDGGLESEIDRKEAYFLRRLEKLFTPAPLPPRTFKRRRKFAA